MGFDAWLTLVVVAVMVAALATERLAPAAAVLGATAVLYITGVVDTAAAFQGFSNPAPLAVAALYVLARAVEVTGGLEPVLRRVLAGRPGADGQPTRPSDRRLLAKLLPPVAAWSGVLNNTPIVAMLAPQVAAWASQRGRSAARLLMPISFAAILGGLLTTIGTSTNLVVSGLLEAAGQAPLGMFEITRVGAPVAVIGLLTVLAVAPVMLRPRRSAFDLVGDAGVRQFSFDMMVEPGGPLAGRSVAEAGLRDLQGVYLVQIERDGERITPVAPDRRLRGGDVLSFAGKVDQIIDLQRTRGLASTEQHHLADINGADQQFFEVVVGADSPLSGRTLKAAGFRNRYGGAVLAIHRAGERLDAKLGEVPLRPGDTLLVLADDGFHARWRNTPDFLVVAPSGGSAPALTRKAPLVGAVALGIVVTAATGLLSILQAALLGALVLVAARVLSPAQARNAVDLSVVVTIAAAFGVGAAVAESGLADVLAGGIVDVFAPLGALGALAGVMLATLVLTELVTNNAAAVLMFPIAQAAASGVGADPRPFAIAVALVASAAFLTPIGYQTNLIVYGLGGYRFTDFARLGGVLTPLVLVTGLLVIPVAWPL